ncbi:MAG TPA: hypothetical protein VK469_06080, partial [Candidatus Kapabacteria bacterium]|nr:hypothetical protein [Candidatus Kapabacteria bacterium]
MTKIKCFLSEYKQSRDENPSGQAFECREDNKCALTFHSEAIFFAYDAVFSLILLRIADYIFRIMACAQRTSGNP